MDEFKSQSPAPAATTGQAWDSAEGFLARCADRLNPILVKEARQALKSKQFSITFTLLLACGWTWSLVGIALLSPGVYYAPGGAFMLVGYFFILATPTLVVVPFSAFRSLAAEREDGTYELLSITSLGSRQIVTGKLGSALLQMMVYYSALAPCVAFTYLLRGVDIVTIIFVLVATLLVSTLLSAVGLVVATISAARHWQIVLSVVLLIILLWSLGVWLMSMTQLISFAGQVPFDEPGFWAAMLAIFTFYVSFLALAVQASAAQLSFDSDNRSTRIRILLICQQVLWMGWMGYLWIRSEEEAVLFVVIAIAAIYWALFGSLLCGELARLSPRVKRALPQSFLGRTFFTWLNPGSGTGYAFTVANLVAVGLMVTAMGVWAQAVGFEGAPDDAEWLLFTWLCVAYVVLYLGVGRMLLLLARRFIPVGIARSVLINALLAAAGTLIPTFLQAWVQGYRRLDYTPFQFTNWAWTLAMAAEEDLLAYPLAPLLVTILALLVCLLNLGLTAGEVEQVRQEVPQRVIEDKQVATASTAEG